MAWAIKTKLFRGDSAWYVYNALRWYLLSIACTVVLDTIQLRLNSRKAQRLRELRNQFQKEKARNPVQTPDTASTVVRDEECEAFSSKELDDLKNFGEEDAANALGAHREYLQRRTHFSIIGANAQKELDFIYDKQIQIIESFIKNFLDIISAANTLYHWNLSQGTRGWLNIISAFIAGRRLWMRLEAEALAERQRSLQAGEKSGAMGGYDWTSQNSQDLFNKLHRNHSNEKLEL